VVRAQRQITSGRRPLPVGHLTMQPHGWPHAVGRRENLQHGDAAEKLRIDELGTTRDAHAARSLEPEP
jgi:hypothetical protein